MSFHTMILTVPIAFAAFGAAAADPRVYTVQYQDEYYDGDYGSGYDYDADSYYDDGANFDPGFAGEREPRLWQRLPGMKATGGEDAAATQSVPEKRCSRFYSNRRSAKSPLAASPRC